MAVNKTRLTRVRFMVPRDTDVVVCEFVVRSWELELRHVAGGAISGGDFAEFGGAL